MDAIGFLQLGGTFVSFMSGNSTQMGVGLGRGEWQGLDRFGAVIGMFVLGVLGASLLRRVIRRRPQAAMLGVVTGVLLAASMLQAANEVSLAVDCVVLAMGVENIVLQTRGNTRLGLTYMTGTLVRMAEHMATALVGGARWAWVFDLLLWGGMVCGAVAGGLAFAAAGLSALWGGVGFAACLTLLAARMDEASAEAPSGSGLRGGHG